MAILNHHNQPIACTNESFSVEGPTITDFGAEVFGRIRRDGNVDLLTEPDGESANRIDDECLEPNCHIRPVGSEFGIRYEHAEGIVLSPEDAETLGVEIE